VPQIDIGGSNSGEAGGERRELSGDLAAEERHGDNRYNRNECDQNAIFGECGTFLVCDETVRQTPDLSHLKPPKVKLNDKFLMIRAKIGAVHPDDRPVPMLNDYARNEPGPDA
jgi:hypothetical protein